MRARLYDWLQNAWYHEAPGAWLLLPLSGIYRLIVGLRSRLYRAGILSSVDVGVPVVVVGNITAGGTGKTPVTIWLAAALRERGFSPGIVSRGYGGSGSATSMRVDSASDPAIVGDEPVLIARRSDCPVIVDSDRVRAAGRLIEEGADVIIADDGLQHLRLERSYEICVLDGRRRLGNGHVLPRGPLREPASRLDEVDQVLVNGPREDDSGLSQQRGEIGFELVARIARRLDGTESKPIGEFAGRTVHAVAAIGNPVRFFDMLRGNDIRVVAHSHPDHATLGAADLEFEDGLDVVITEKDAVKLDPRRHASCWYVPVDVDLPLAEAWLDRLELRLRENHVAGKSGGES
jgi:tetraacyldisaccharide 4'-kinase